MEVDDRLINIYCITNLKNGKQYIGQTARTIEERFKEHCAGYGYSISLIYQAIKKYGKENFDLILLEVVERAIACKRETFYIKKFNTSFRSHGYNLTSPSPSSMNKGRMSKEHRLICAEQARKNHKLPRTEKQIKAFNNNIKIAQKLPRTEKQLFSSSEKRNEAGKVNIKLAQLSLCKKVRVFESEIFSRVFDSYVEAEKFYNLPHVISQSIKLRDGYYRKKDLYFFDIAD